MKKYILPFLLLALALAACNTPNTPGAEVTPTPTEQVTPTPEVSDTETDQGVYIAALLREAAQIQKIDAEFEYGTGQFIAQSRSTIESMAVEFYYALRAQLESLEDIDLSVFWDPEADRAPLEAFLDELKSFRSEECPITWANVSVRKTAGYELKGLEGEKVDVQYSGGFSLFYPTERQFRFAGLPIDHRLTFVCRDRRWYISAIEDTGWQPYEEDGTRYFFAQTFFLGAWSDGQWRSCEDGGFTVGEIFGRDYYDAWGETLGTVRFSVGPGAFNETFGEVEGIELLEPYGILEGDEFIMKLPGRLTREAAQVIAPDYNFWAYFEGQPHYLVSNVPMESPSYRRDVPLLEVGASVLEEAGIHSDFRNMDREVWACDMDGDGQEEYLELYQTLFDENGYAILEPGDQCFYILLLRDGEEVSVVASRAMDYTTDVTAHFSAGDVQFCDLDGDGICEIIFSEQCWEWGCYKAYSLIDGVWTLVLQSNYGM